VPLPVDSVRLQALPGQGGALPAGGADAAPPPDDWCDAEYIPDPSEEPPTEEELWELMDSSGGPACGGPDAWEREVLPEGPGFRADPEHEAASAGPAASPPGFLPPAGGDRAVFGAGGAADTMAPGEVLAGLAGDVWAEGLPKVTDDELIGLMRAWRRLSSWAQAGELAAVAELDRRRQAEVRAGADPHLGEHVADEVAMPLTLTARAADGLLDFAIALGRLPRTRAALASGVIDRGKAHVIASEVAGLDGPHAAAVEAAVIGRAPRMTTGQLRAATRRAVLAADPAAAGERREQARKDARVEVWDEHAGTAALAGRDLPPADVLAADRRIAALARHLKNSGAEGSLDQLRARVFTALLTGRTVDLVPLTAAHGGDSQDGRPPAPAAAGKGGEGKGGSQCNGGSRGNGGSQGKRGSQGSGGSRGSSASSGERGSRDERGSPGERGSRGSSGSPGERQPDECGGRGSDGSWDEGDSRAGADMPAGLAGTGVAGTAGTSGGWGAAGDSVTPEVVPAVAELAAGTGITGSVNLTMPLATWLGAAEAPGDVAGFGPLPADDARALARLLAEQPRARWCLTFTDSTGRAVAHGCARAGPAPPGPARRPGPAHSPAPARIPGPAHSPPGADPPGRWQLTVTVAALATGTCDHERECHGYQPSAALRHLLEIRHQRCTAPGCRRPATQCDLDHTVPYREGGRTCECGLAPLCRRHHRAKQAQGWQLDQPEPGVLTWRLPHGRSYRVTPAPYPPEAR
jgi:hypothetical protein